MKTKLFIFIALITASFFAYQSISLTNAQTGSECLIQCGGKCWKPNTQCPVQGSEGSACDQATGKAYCKQTESTCKNAGGFWCPQTPDKCWKMDACAQSQGDYKCFGKGEYDKDRNFEGAVCQTRNSSRSSSGGATPQLGLVSSVGSSPNPNSGFQGRPTYEDPGNNARGYGGSSSNCCALGIPFTSVCLIPAACSTNPPPSGGTSGQAGVVGSGGGEACNPETQLDITNACNTACCSSSSDCPGSSCSVGNGYCKFGKSCYDTSRPGGGGPAAYSTPTYGTPSGSNPLPPAPNPPGNTTPTCNSSNASIVIRPTGTCQGKNQCFQAFWSGSSCKETPGDRWCPDDRPCPTATAQPTSQATPTADTGSADGSVGWGGSCTRPSQCNSSSLRCYEGQCLRPPGTATSNCKHPKECASGKCENGTCSQ